MNLNKLPKYLCKTPVINNKSDLDRLFNEIHDEYLTNNHKEKKDIIISDDKNSNVLKEWICLTSFLQKNMTQGLNFLRIKYPFHIHKNESPDFIISTLLRDYRIEVTRTITQNLANLYNLSKRMGKPIKTINKIRLLKDDVILTEEELLDYLNQDGQPDYYYGWPEIDPWVKLMYERINEKNKKRYCMDVLLIDDQHTICSTNDSDTLERAIYKLLHKLEKNPIQINNIKQIIADNPVGLLKLYNSPKWKYILKTNLHI